MPIPAGDKAKKLNKVQKLVLSAGLGILIVILAIAFVIQAPTFPENDFESSLYIAGIIGVYMVVLLSIWR